MIIKASVDVNLITKTQAVSARPMPNESRPKQLKWAKPKHPNFSDVSHDQSRCFQCIVSFQRLSHYVRLSHGNKPSRGLKCFTVSDALLLFRHRCRPQETVTSSTKPFSSLLFNHMNKNVSIQTMWWYYWWMALNEQTNNKKHTKYFQLNRWNVALETTKLWHDAHNS